jgi:hypothetical protein
MEVLSNIEENVASGDDLPARIYVAISPLSVFAAVNGSALAPDGADSGPLALDL